MNRSFVVTGADGFIGKMLVSQLINQGDRVYAVVRKQNTMIEFENEKNFHLILAAFEEYKNLAKYIDEPVDTFFHMAWAGVSGASVNSYQAQIDNIKAACDAVCSAIEIKCQNFFIAGSIQQHVCATKDGKVVDSSTLYGSAKQCAINMCFEIGKGSTTNVKSAMFPNVFGVGDYSSRSTNRLIRDFLDGVSPQLITGNEPYDCIYIDDALNGLMAVVNQGKTGVCYYVGNQKLISFQQMVTKMRETLNPAVPLSFGAIKNYSYTDYSQIDLDGLCRDTGFQVASDFADSIKRTAQWVQEKDLPRKECK